MIVMPEGCRRELQEFPEAIRGDLADALARLDAGLRLSMPLSRSMPSVGKGVHELRLKDRSGAYHVIYALLRSGVVHVRHGFKKTTRTTPRTHIELARRRLREQTR